MDAQGPGLVYLMRFGTSVDITGELRQGRLLRTI
jgi:hypothetical protein